MDPALYELIESSAEGSELDALIKLRPGRPAPPDVHVVARFGDIATVRLRREQVCAVREHEDVESLKAPRPVACEPLPPDATPPDPGGPSGGTPAPAGAEPAPDGPWLAKQPHNRGAGVVVGVLDWGLDFAHPNLRRPDGSTRLLALWDQREAMDPARPNRYGYGVIHDRATIDAALRADNPYAALGYHPADVDPRGTGAHGTHVVDIAAGSGRVQGAQAGLAADADLVFVHLATRGLHGLATLGDSVRLAEGLDFLARTAGDRPWVCNLSVGKIGGPHDGSTLLEQAMDALLEEAPGRAIVQSCGNYADTRTHSTGRVRPMGTHVLRWQVQPTDVTPNELEIWYRGCDRLVVELQAPGDGPRFRARLGQRAAVTIDGNEVGRIYHRASDPNNDSHHVDLFLFQEAPSGVWRVMLHGEDVVDGRFDAWIERDTHQPGTQSRFLSRDAIPDTTLGTICNGRRTIAVGAIDPRHAGWPVARFSSAGPTRDGRLKPDVLAPGVAVRAAQSTPRSSTAPAALLTEKSGTSMAAPHVTGAVALMLAEAHRPLPIAVLRALLLGSAEPASHIDTGRAGHGYLHVERALAAVRSWSAGCKQRKGAPARPYLPAGGRDFAPAAARFHCTPIRAAVRPAAYLPQPVEPASADTGPDADAISDAIIDEALEAAGLDAAQRRGIARAGLRPLARAFGAEAFTELVGRLGWTPEDVARRGSDAGGMLVPRLLLHVPGHFRELARRAPDAREAHALESLGWLLMAALRDQVAQATERRWWLPPAPAFVTALPAPLPSLSPEVACMARCLGLVDDDLEGAAYEARLRRWQQGLAGRQWREEVAGQQPGLPFYPALVDIPAHVDTTATREGFARAWQRRLAATDRAHPPTPGHITLEALRNAAALRTCRNRQAPPGRLAPLGLQGLALAGAFPMESEGRVVTRLPVLDALRPVYEALFRTLRELGWNDLVYQTAGAGCFRGVKHPAAATVTLPEDGGREVVVDPFPRPTAQAVERIARRFTPAQKQQVLDAMQAARTLSNHALGAAIDINEPENPQGVAEQPFGCMDPRVVALLEAFRFRWGACFRISDPMHFEYCEQPGAPEPDADRGSDDSQG